MEKIKLSIITVSYNSERTISETIVSVLNQTSSDFEYILIDGNSQDNTVSLIKSFETDFLNRGINYKWVSEKDDGIYDAMNKGIKLASNSVIGFLNSDDYFHDNNVVQDILETFTIHGCDCLYGNIKIIKPKSNNVIRTWISREFSPGLFEKSWTPAHPTFYCKKDIYKIFGFYNTDFKIAADSELMFRFLDKYKIHNYFLNRYFVIMRQGGVSSKSIKSTIVITKEMKKAFEIHGRSLNVAKYLFYKFLKIREFHLRGKEVCKYE